jgi:hypothetical protein
MKIEKGQYVECLLKNGWVISGVVEELDSSGLTLSRKDEKGKVIILRPSEEISVIKVFFSGQEILKEKKSVPRPQPIVKSEIEETFDLPSDAPDRIKMLAELRQELNRREREDIVNRLRSHEVGDVRKVEYGYPGLFKKPSTK